MTDRSTFALAAATPADADPLAAMGRQAFTDTFGHLYASADLACFLDAAFGADGLPAQLADPAYTVRVATAGDRIVGYAKLGPVVFPGDWPEGAIELHQLYVLGDHHGTGVGPALMRWATAEARRRGAPELLLSVYVDNHRARRFYERRGFVDIGRYDFPVGDHLDEDRLMRLVL